MQPCTYWGESHRFIVVSEIDGRTVEACRCGVRRAGNAWLL